MTMDSDKLLASVGLKCIALVTIRKFKQEFLICCVCVTHNFVHSHHLHFLVSQLLFTLSETVLVSVV